MSRILLAASRSAVVEEPAFAVPYSPSALWNVPAAGRATDSRSTVWTDRLFTIGLPGGTVGNLNLSGVPQDYTYPVYHEAEGTTPYTVNTTYGNMRGRTVQWNPSWAIPGGTDQQIIILNASTGAEHNAWQLTVNNTTRVITGSRWNRLNVEQTEGSLGTLLDYRTGSGIFRPSRGCGIAYRAMLITPEEVSYAIANNTSFGHAVTLVLSGQLAESAYVPPASKSDGGNTPGTGIPEGARFCLTITDAQITGAINRMPSDLAPAYKNFARAMFRTLRDYGAIAADQGGVHIGQMEHTASAQARWNALGIGAAATPSDFKEYPRDSLDALWTELGGTTAARAYFRWIQ